MAGVEGYAPGWGEDALAMLRARDAETRAAFVLPALTGAARIVDVGCGPGTITEGLARAAPTASVVGIDVRCSQLASARRTAAVAGVANVAFACGSAHRLPLSSGSVDVVFAHALMEHLAAPVRALTEFARVLRVGGVVAASSSDWSSAELDPADADVAAALEGHYLLRRRAGVDPFAGAVLATHVAAAGFVDIVASRVGREDMTYGDLGRYVGSRLHAAPGNERAAAAADRWSGRRGRFVQSWVDVTARRPSDSSQKGGGWSSSRRAAGAGRGVGMVAGR